MVFIAEQVMEYHLQAIDELSIPDGSVVDNVDHLDTTLPVTSKCVCHCLVLSVDPSSERIKGL